MRMKIYGAWSMFLSSVVLLSFTAFGVEAESLVAVPTSIQDRQEVSEAQEQHMHLIAGVRQRILDDETLSLEGKNVMIIDAGDRVILRGRVPTEGEFKKVEELARKAANRLGVVNELQVDTALGRHE